MDGDFNVRKSNDHTVPIFKMAFEPGRVGAVFFAYENTFFDRVCVCGTGMKTLLVKA